MNEALKRSIKDNEEKR